MDVFCCMKEDASLNWLVVALGGAIGSMLRYGLGLLANLPAWPIGTWLANVAGSFLIGFLFVWGKEKGLLAPHTYLLLTTGLMGGFTTFSTFSLEVVTMSLQGQLIRAIVYGLSSVGVGLLAAYLGLRLGRTFLL